jgi:hypothetical protein
MAVGIAYVSAIPVEMTKQEKEEMRFKWSETRRLDFN